MAPSVVGVDDGAPTPVVIPPLEAAAELTSQLSWAMICNSKIGSFTMPIWLVQAALNTVSKLQAIVFVELEF